MMKFTSERRCGLECGSAGAKMVLLACHDTAFQVDNVFIEDVPLELRIKGKTRPPLDVARQLLIHNNLSGYKTVFVANGAVESCFVILPRMSKAETDGALLLQAKKLVFWELEKPGMGAVGSELLRDRMGYLVGLADNNAVSAWCRLIEGSGGVIDDVTIEASAYQALAQCQGWADEFSVLMVADLGAAASTVYILDRQTVKFMRKIPMGGDAITKALATEVPADGSPMLLTDSEAEEMKITGQLPMAGKRDLEFLAGPTVRAVGPAGESSPAGPPAAKRIEQMEALTRPVIERIVSEIMRSVQFFRDNSGQKVEAVFLTGGTASLPILQKHLETTVGLPVRLIDPFAGLTFTNPSARKYAEKHRMRLALAVGLALAEHPIISLLPRYVQMLKRLASFAFMPRLVLGLMILVFFPLLFAGTCQEVKIKSVRANTQSYQQQLHQVDQEHQRLAAFQTRVQESSEYFLALQNILGRNPLWPGVLNALADAMSPGVVLTRFSAGIDLEYADVIMLEGKTLSTPDGFDNMMSSLLTALSSSVFFKRVIIISAKADRGESMTGTFEIQCELVY